MLIVVGTGVVEDVMLPVIADNRPVLRDVARLIDVATEITVDEKADVGVSRATPVLVSAYTTIPPLRTESHAAPVLAAPAWSGNSMIVPT